MALYSLSLTFVSAPPTSVLEAVVSNCRLLTTRLMKLLGLQRRRDRRFAAIIEMATPMNTRISSITCSAGNPYARATAPLGVLRTARRPQEWPHFAFVALLLRPRRLFGAHSTRSLRSLVEKPARSDGSHGVVDLRCGGIRLPRSDTLRVRGRSTPRPAALRAATSHHAGGCIRLSPVTGVPDPCLTGISRLRGGGPP